MVTTNVIVETEKLVFPFSSLVAEFGGTLSLFIGVSFVSLVDAAQNVLILCKLIKKV